MDATQLDYMTVPMLSHWHWNLNAHLNIYSNESIFFWKIIQESILIIEMMIQNNITRLERMEVLITFHVWIFLDSIDSKYNSYIYIYIHSIYIYIYILWYNYSYYNTKVTPTSNIYEKINEKEEERIWETYL